MTEINKEKIEVSGTNPGLKIVCKKPEQKDSKPAARLVRGVLPLDWKPEWLKAKVLP